MVLEIIGLIILVIGLLIASIIDMKTKEVPDWLSNTLIISGFSIAILQSIFSYSLLPLFYTLKAFFVFFFIGYFLYYTKQWGGGDTKLLWGISTLLPLYPNSLLTIFNPKLNLDLIWIIPINLFIVWALYGILYSFYLILKSRKYFFKEISKNKILSRKEFKIILVFLFLISLFSFISLPIDMSLLLLGIMLFSIFFIFLSLSLKAIEKVSMIKIIPLSKLREGDWVQEKIFLNKKLIYSPSFEGITKEQIKLAKKTSLKKIKIKEGMAFVPAILITILVTLIYGNLISYLI